MEIDHVLLAAADLAAAAREIETRHGLVSIEGGRHPDWGTANRIVPLGASYLELVAVVDAGDAATSAFGRWVAAGAGDPLRPLGWAVRVADIDAVARRLGLDVLEGSRETPDGNRLRWRSAGIDEAAAKPVLPFFIEWGDDSTFPGRAGDGGLSLRRLELDGDETELDEWVGTHALPIDVRPGSPRLRCVELTDVARVIALGETAA